MCLLKFLDLCSFEKVFKLACALLTFLLIGQELVNFAITKPTVTSMEEKGLETDDIPEAVICFEPGFDKEKLKKYGYNRTVQYYRGVRPSDFKFIGWNGAKNEIKSSLEILEEALFIKDNDVKFITKALYLADSGDSFHARVNFTSLAWPYGRCFSITPTIPQEKESTEINTLYLSLNQSVFKNQDLQGPQHEDVFHGKHKLPWYSS